MEHTLHGSARTTLALRQAIQASTESRQARRPLRGKPQNGGQVAPAQDAPMGLKNPVSTMLSPAEEAAAVASLIQRREVRNGTRFNAANCL